MKLFKKEKSKVEILASALERIKEEPIDSLFDVKRRIVLENFVSRGGNVSSYELQVLSLIAINISPKTLVEIGTFDGTTTLQLALNSPEDAMVHTLDLPPGEGETLLPSLDHDKKYIVDSEKQNRKYIGTVVEKKVVQHLGDSANYPFEGFTERGMIDFCFIDGGHSYEIVKSDTEKVLPLMSDGGIICWHDFDHRSVCLYLGELSEKLPLTLIAGTKLVMHKRAGECYV